MKSIPEILPEVARKQGGVRINERGNTVYQVHCEGSRYEIDFDETLMMTWKQYDTDQDASYFGQWVNPTHFQTLCYCEGDWIMVCCVSAEAYNREIQYMNDYYGKGKIATVIDFEAKTTTTYHQNREEFFIREA